MANESLVHAYPVHSTPEEWAKHERSFDCWCGPDRDARTPNLVIHKGSGEDKMQ